MLVAGAYAKILQHTHIQYIFCISFFFLSSPLFPAVGHCERVTTSQQTHTLNTIVLIKKFIGLFCLYF